MTVDDLREALARFPGYYVVAVEGEDGSTLVVDYVGLDEPGRFPVVLIEGDKRKVLGYQPGGTGRD